MVHLLTGLPVYYIRIQFRNSQMEEAQDKVWGQEQATTYFTVLPRHYTLPEALQTAGCRGFVKVSLG